MHAHMHVGSPPSSRCGYIVYRDLNDFSWQLLLSRSSLCSRKTMKCSSVPVFLIDAANSSVPSVLQHRMDFPGVGSWDHVTVHVPSFCSLDSFRFHPLNCCCFTTSTLLLPATPPIRLCAEANPEGRRSRTKPWCQPLYYRPGLLRHGGYVSAVPDLWDLSACL
jgi:hypothetical protein